MWQQLQPFLETFVERVPWYIPPFRIVRYLQPQDCFMLPEATQASSLIRQYYRDDPALKIREDEIPTTVNWTQFETLSRPLFPFIQERTS
jgi:hypothetical protein